MRLESNVCRGWIVGGYWLQFTISLKLILQDQAVLSPFLWGLFCLLHTINCCVFCAPQTLHKYTCNICVVILCCNICRICVVTAYVSNSFLTFWVPHSYVTTQSFSKSVHSVNVWWMNEYQIVSRSKWYRVMQKGLRITNKYRILINFFEDLKPGRLGK